MSTIPLSTEIDEQPWVLPDRGITAMILLIIAEASIFIIFVVAYIFYAGKSLSGPKPADVLELPIFSSICLLSSSVTAHFAVSALRKSAVRSCAAAWPSTRGCGKAGKIALASDFSGVSTARQFPQLSASGEAFFDRKRD